MSIRLQQVTASSITYEQYATAIDCIASGKTFEQAGLGSWLMGFFNPLKKIFEQVKDAVGLGMDELAAAFKAKSVFKLMKAIRFNVKLLWKGVQECALLIRKGLVTVFKELQKNKVFQKLRDGLIKVDEVLDHYPILKKLAGPALAGLLFYLWWVGAFIGHTDTDLDISFIGLALVGKFSLADLFTSDDGLILLSTFGLGMVAPTASFPWLVYDIANFVLAIAFTGFKYLKDKEQTKRILQLMPFKRP